MPSSCSKQRPIRRMIRSITGGQLCFRIQKSLIFPSCRQDPVTESEAARDPALNSTEQSLDSTRSETLSFAEVATPHESTLEERMS